MDLSVLKSCGSQRPELAGVTQVSVTKAPSCGDMGTAKGGDSYPPSDSLCTQLCPRTTGARSTHISHYSCPESSPSTLASTLEGQITSPNQVNLPPLYFRSAQPGFPLGAAGSDFSPGLTKLVGPCASPSRPFDGESLPNK